MKTDFTNLSVYADSADGKKAADILAREIKLRTKKTPVFSESETTPCVAFKSDRAANDPDAYRIDTKNGMMTVTAKGIRGFIYGIGLFLRKTTYLDGKITLVCDIDGCYSPDKKIRGHQLGYRPLSNTYDAWDLDDYERAYLDIMFFGANTVEHIPERSDSVKRNELMKYEPNELLSAAAVLADGFDLDVSLWYPNSEDDINDAVRERRDVFDNTKRINAVFPPGGDPGSLPANELIERCRVFKKLLQSKHPSAGMWPSAQAPHSVENWGESLMNELKRLPEEIDGIITGPNHAFPLPELRRRVPSKYPIRFYPDITHNLRCEHPVHFDRDDWSFALAAANGREAINPRPEEYRLLHSLVSPYTVGSVSYSEGANDDVNKAVWCALEWDSNTKTHDIIKDYARLFFYGADENLVSDGIFGLEKNWEGQPENNPQIENTLRIFNSLEESSPSLKNNSRFLMCLFRAQTDAYVRRRVVFDNDLISDASALIKKGDINGAFTVLSAEYPVGTLFLRKEMEETAEKLFDLLGIQLGTARFHADGWERGAVLDTADLPVTDRQWLLGRLENAEKMSPNEARRYMLRSLDRNKVDTDEYYFSVALDGLSALGAKQVGEFYIDTQADRPNINNGTLPTGLFKLYDHFSFRASLGGFSAGTDYILMISYSNSTPDERCDFKIKANGKTVYAGDRFGGIINEKYTSEMLTDRFTAVMYTLPSDCFENGCIDLEITEPVEGFKFGEFRITKKAYGEDII